MFADSLSAMVIAALAPEGWAAMAVVVAVAVASQRRARHEGTPANQPPRAHWISELATLLVIPVGLLIAAGQMSDPALAGQRDMKAVLFLLGALLLIQLALGSWLIWRHRHRWLGTVVLAGVVCWWTLGAAFIANMALTDNWL